MKIFFQSSLFIPTTTTEMKNETCSSSSNLFPYDNIITKEIDTWKSYADCLRKQDRELFYKMLNSCYKYSPADYCTRKRIFYYISFNVNFAGTS